MNTEVIYSTEKPKIDMDVVSVFSGSAKFDCPMSVKSHNSNMDLFSNSNLFQKNENEQTSLLEHIKNSSLGKQLSNKGDSKSFRLQTKSVLLTYPRCSLSKEYVRNYIIEKFGVTMGHYCVCVESHKNGIKHVHCTIRLKEILRIRSCTYFDIVNDSRRYHPNIESCKDYSKCVRYVKKGGDFLEGGVMDEIDYTNKPQDMRKKADRALKNRILLCNNISDLVLQGDVRLADAYNLKRCQNIVNLDSNSAKVTSFVPRIAIWIHGSAGIGKSRWIRKTFGTQAWPKSQNKWWDGYNQQPVVYIDDFDKNGSVLSHYFKIWTDIYSFNGEIKGDTIIPTYYLFIVTSNYTPREIWNNDSKQFEVKDYQLLDAIERRVVMCTISKDELICTEDGSKGDVIYSKVRAGDVVDWRSLYCQRELQLKGSEEENENLKFNIRKNIQVFPGNYSKLYDTSREYKA